jgi:uncharacterized protein
VPVRWTTEVARFLAAAGPFLVAREAEHNLILGVCSRLASDPSSYVAPPFLAYAEHGGAVVGAAIRTPPYNIVLSESDEATWIEPMAHEAHAVFDRLPGVLGPKPSAEAFAEAWRTLTGNDVEPTMANRIYRASRAEPPTNVSGRMRTYTSADRTLVLSWLEAFAREAFPAGAMESSEVVLDRRLDDPDGDLLLWEDAGRPVSLAGYGTPTPNGIRVGPVYTPPGLRGRGYASALVGQMTAMLLDGGRRFCFLFTDLANPTSNSIYRRIGYEPVSDVDELRFR